MVVIRLQQNLLVSASETAAEANADTQNTHISGKQCSRVLLQLQYYVFFLLRAYFVNFIDLRIDNRDENCNQA